MNGCSKGLLAELFTDTLSDEAATDLVRIVTPAKVKAAMFSIDGGRAPGPDGFTVQFFQVCWSIIGKEVEKVIIHFFTTNELLPAFNSIIMALVSKCRNPNCIRDYRPISCCNVVYKFSKTKGLSAILPESTFPSSEPHVNLALLTSFFVDQKL